jgi:hypothetical protein
VKKGRTAQKNDPDWLGTQRSRTYLSTLRDCDWNLGVIVWSTRDCLDLADHEETVNDSAKNNVLAIKKVSLCACDVELQVCEGGERARHGRIVSGVRHRTAGSLAVDVKQQTRDG